MKKVGLLISSLNNGGAERVVSRLSKILSSEFKVFIILFEDTFVNYDYCGELINLDIKANKSSFKVIPTIKRSLLLRKTKKELSLDCVISFLDSPNVVNILSKTPKCKVAISIRNYSLNENKNSLLSRITNLCIKLLYNSADSVIPVSRVIASSMEAHYGIKKDKINVIYNPYDIIEIQEKSSEEIEDKYSSFFNNGKVFISVGRDMYQKGFWHLVKAFKLVHDNCPEAKLVIVGRDNNDGKTLQLVKALNIEKSVLLMGQHDNPFKFIKASSIYVMSSLFEGFPNAMVEAMACGCCIIAADCKSGPREILCKNPDIKHVSNDIEMADFGIIVPPLCNDENWDPTHIDASEIALAGAMNMVIESKDIVNYYSKRAMPRARDFSYEICREKFRSIING